MHTELTFVEEDIERVKLRTILAVANYDGPHQADLVRVLVDVIERMHCPPPVFRAPE